jgi:hypothetical protein
MLALPDRVQVMGGGVGSGPTWTHCSSGLVAPNRRRLARCGQGHAGTRAHVPRGDGYDKGAFRNLGPSAHTHMLHAAYT